MWEEMSGPDSGMIVLLSGSARAPQGGTLTRERYSLVVVVVVGETERKVIYKHTV